MKQFRHQGDVSLYPYKGKLTGELLDHRGVFTLAFGEATGHNHQLKVANPDDLKIVETQGGYIFSLASKGVITHQEHEDIELHPGVYRSGREREEDWFARTARPRTVSD